MGVSQGLKEISERRAAYEERRFNRSLTVRGNKMLLNGSTVEEVQAFVDEETLKRLERHTGFFNRFTVLDAPGNEPRIQEELDQRRDEKQSLRLFRKEQRIRNRQSLKGLEKELDLRDRSAERRARQSATIQADKEVDVATRKAQQEEAQETAKREKRQSEISEARSIIDTQAQQAAAAGRSFDFDELKRRVAANETEDMFKEIMRPYFQEELQEVLSSPSIKNYRRLAKRWPQFITEIDDFIDGLGVEAE